ncbi:IS110 family transposase, partial [Kushneria aurantia]
MAKVEELVEVVLGVDTHLDVHVGVVVDPAGRVLGTRSIETCTDGYQALLEWAHSFGFLLRAGIEGTGTYGAGLARHIQEAGIEVLEVNRPDRARRRRRG